MPPAACALRRASASWSRICVGAAAGIAAGMRVIEFGGSHAGGQLANHLRAAGASTVISDLRALKSTIIDLRGW